MTNPYKGEIELLIDGKPHQLVFDWNALSTIYAQVGPDAAREILRQDKLYSHSPDQLALIVHAALRKHHPDVTLEMLKDGLPSYIVVISAIARGVSLAYLGVDIGDTAEVANELAEDGSGSDSKKK